MRRTVCALAAVVFLVLILASTAEAALDVQVTVGSPTINPNETQTITATSNEAGEGIVLVLQPTDGSPEFPSTLVPLLSFLDAETQAAVMGEIDGKVVSYKLVTGTDNVLTFPDDFTGINGDPSTAVMGKYMVLFAFGSIGGDKLVEVDFTIGSWFVIPDVPWGTVTALGAMLCALPLFGLFKKRRLV